MTRRLMLLRHAKSSWDNPRLEDFDRPLNPRGRRDAPRIGIAMRNAGLLPDQALCSTARRTRDTLALVGPRLGGDLPVTYLDRIYEAPADTLLEVVRNAAPETTRLLLVGHNTGIETLALRLVGPNSNPQAVLQLEEKFPTCAVAVLDFDIDRWSAVGEASGRLMTFLRPRDLRIAQSDFQKRSA
jgi:phosphohistidine phosphatase